MNRISILGLALLTACGGSTPGQTGAGSGATTAASGSVAGSSSATGSSNGAASTSGSPTTASSTSSGGASSSTSGGTTGGTSCPGYAAPNESASCPCGSGHTCAANGCYNGWYCDLAANRCVAPPSQCGSTSSTSGTTSTTGPSSSTTSGGTTGHGGPFRVLFDAAHKQVAGNACWIVDSNMPDPQPASPGSETDWSGGISAWGFDLWQSGRYSIAQLPSGSSLNYGQGGRGDLSNFDVFVSDEPELQFSSGEQNALMTFANAGGGIFLVSDHSGAVRCSSCTEATQVINDFLVSGQGTAFGASCDNNDVGSNGLLGAITGQGPASIGSGPFGTGNQLSYHSGSTVSATGSAQVVINSGSGGMMVASQLSSGGRLVLVGDSSPEEDGTTSSCSVTLHNGWGEADDRVLILNATAWVAHDGS